MSFSQESPNSSDTDVLTVSESYDVATMIVSELAYIHAVLKDIRPPQPVYYPGDKVPAQVFVRAGILAIQLDHLHQLIRDNPHSFRLGDRGSVGANEGRRDDGWR